MQHYIETIAHKTGVSEQQVANILRKIRTRDYRNVTPSYYLLTYNTGVRKKVYRWSSKYELCRDVFCEDLKEYMKMSSKEF